MEAKANNSNETDDLTLNTEEMDQQQLQMILEMKDQLNEAKTKLLLQERDLKEIDKYQNRITELEGQLDDYREQYESLDGAFASEKEMNTRLTISNQELAQRNEVLLVAYIVQSHPTKNELPLEVFTQNMKGSDHRWKVENAVELPIEDRWVIRKNAGSKNCEIIRRK